MARKEMITLTMPKDDIETFLRIVEDIKFFEGAEKGNKEIDEGKFITLSNLKKKHKIR